FCFQAEDGIRDRNVTGVQTCALPISELGTDLIASWLATIITGKISNDIVNAAAKTELPSAIESMPIPLTKIVRPSKPNTTAGTQIGRASCRERGRSAERDVEVKRRKK